MTRVIVIGLGYVGLPLAVAMAKSFETWGFDIDPGRIDELRNGHDRTGEIARDTLEASTLQLTGDLAACPAADFYIVTVPTPVDASNAPDLSMVRAATRLIAPSIDPARTPVIVYESTVYPGVTEDICGPEFEQATGLVCGKDFFLGYSPERINPGDREHTVDRIVKVVSGQDAATLDRVADLYGAITTAGVYRAASIKAAEAAKVIENSQRDLNVAFVNEIARIFAKMDLSVWDVLAAARTKWNFLPFEPGLVGGHCIGVDPYYLAFRAKELGVDAGVILAGREMNDDMAAWVANQIHARRGQAGTALVLGLAFKPDVPDLRNSKVADLVRALETLGHDVTVHDPLVDADAAHHEYGLALDETALERRYDTVVLAVPHRVFIDNDLAAIVAAVAPGGLLADLKNAIGADRRAAAAVEVWTL